MNVMIYLFQDCFMILFHAFVTFLTDTNVAFQQKIIINIICITYHIDSSMFLTQQKIKKNENKIKNFNISKILFEY